MAKRSTGKQLGGVPRIPLPEGTPAFNVSMGCYETVPGHLPVQQLHNDYDIFWVISGEAQWTFRDGSTIRAGKDQFMILPPFVPVWIDESKPKLVFWYCHFVFRPVPERIRATHRADYTGPGARVHVPLSFTRKDAPLVWSAYRDLTEIKLDDLSEHWRFERGILTLIAELAKFAAESGGAPGQPRRFDTEPLDSRIAEIRRLIDDDPIHPWLVSELASVAGVSPGHLHALSRRVLGKSIKRYLIEARLRHAMKLLRERRNGELPSVYEVSEACGFSSQHFFSRQFKTYFNMSPLAFRNGSALT
jgi:AraC-like DNA-binding protein